MERALAAVAAYNARSRSSANLLVSDDALMIWSDNDLPGCLNRAMARTAGERTEAESLVIQRVNFYRQRGVSFVARPKPVAGEVSTERKGRFKKAGNLNRTIEIAEAFRGRGRIVGIGGADHVDGRYRQGFECHHAQ